MSSVVGQGDWSAGIFRAPGGPDGTVYDAVNALVTDDHDLLKRGGVANKANADLMQSIAGVMTAVPIASLWDGYLAPGARTAMLDRQVGTVGLWTLDTDDATPVSVPIFRTDGTARTYDAGIAGGAPRAAALRGAMAWPYPHVGGVGQFASLLVYAGSKNTASHSATGNFSAGSKNVTGFTTSWLSQLQAGDLIYTIGADAFERIIPIASVNSDTQFTMEYEWPSVSGAFPIVAAPAFQYFPLVQPVSAAFAGRMVVAAVNQRLVYGQDRTIRFSQLGQPFAFGTTDFWELPAGAIVLGLDAIHDTCVAFTTEGVWTIANMDFDLTDDAGNVQQQLAQISKDVILWGEGGIAGWSGALVVPALDDVYLLDSTGPLGVISEGIRPLYRSYVKAGYRPGVATVYRGHYFLPVVDGSNAVVDTLVCRLDLRDSRGNARPAWTRWGSGALASAWATRASTGAPKLLCGVGARLREATDAFAPSAANKQDSAVGIFGPTTFDFDVTTRDFDTGTGNRNTVQAVRAHYELEDAAADDPTIAASYAEGPEGSAFTALSGSAPESDGTAPFTWWPKPPVRTRRLRLRFTSSGPSAYLKLRILELLIRPSNRSS